MFSTLNGGWGCFSDFSIEGNNEILIRNVVLKMVYFKVWAETWCSRKYFFPLDWFHQFPLFTKTRSASLTTLRFKCFHKLCSIRKTYSIMMKWLMQKQTFSYKLELTPFQILKNWSWKQASAAISSQLWKLLWIWNGLSSNFCRFLQYREWESGPRVSVELTLTLLSSTWRLELTPSLVNLTTWYLPSLTLTLESFTTISCSPRLYTAIM